MGVSRKLFESAILNRETGKDNWNKPIFEDSSLERVAFDRPTAGIAVLTDEEQATYSNLMFYFTRYSSGTVPTKNDRITYDGQEYHVERVETFRRYKNTPHHYEVYMV